MLEVGTKAPEFTLPDQNGEMHSLSDYRGQKVVLYFYPKDSTPGCTKFFSQAFTLCVFIKLYHNTRFFIRVYSQFSDYVLSFKSYALIIKYKQPCKR